MKRATFELEGRVFRDLRDLNAVERTSRCRQEIMVHGLPREVEAQGVPHLFTQVASSLMPHLVSILERDEYPPREPTDLYVLLLRGHFVSVVSVHPSCPQLTERGGKTTGLEVVPGPLHRHSLVLLGVSVLLFLFRPVHVEVE